MQEVGVDVAESDADLLTQHVATVADGPGPEAGEDLVVWAHKVAILAGGRAPVAERKHHVHTQQHHGDTEHSSSSTVQFTWEHWEYICSGVYYLLSMRRFLKTQLMFSLEISLLLKCPRIINDTTFPAVV